MASDRARDDSAERRRVAIAEVVRAFDRDKCIDADGGRIALTQRLVLQEELNRALARPMDAELRSRDDPEAVLEADLRAAIEAEEVRRQVAERSLAEGPREAVRDAERAAEAGNAQRRRQPDDREVRLRRVHGPVADRWPAARPGPGAGAPHRGRGDQGRDGNMSSIRHGLRCSEAVSSGWLRLHTRPCRSGRSDILVAKAMPGRRAVKGPEISSLHRDVLTLFESALPPT